MFKSDPNTHNNKTCQNIKWECKLSVLSLIHIFLLLFFLLFFSAFLGSFFAQFFIIPSMFTRCIIDFWSYILKAIARLFWVRTGSLVRTVDPFGSLVGMMTHVLILAILLSFKLPLAVCRVFFPTFLEHIFCGSRKESGGS